MYDSTNIHVILFCFLSTHRSRSKFRTRRRASIAPLPAIRLNDKEIMVNSEYDTQSVISGRSVTSISSLASLLKEKVQVRIAKNYKIVFLTAIFNYLGISSDDSKAQKAKGL